MNKNELISEVAGKSGFTKKDVSCVVDLLFETLSDEMVAGNDVKVSGFGTFTVVDRAARTGRNPQTGEAMSIAATKSPKFKPSSTLKSAIKG